MPAQQPASDAGSAADGSEAAYADDVNPGENIWLGLGRRLRALDVIPVAEYSPYSGLLQVAPE